MGKNHGTKKYVTRFCVGCGKELYVRSDSTRIRCDECRKKYMKWAKEQPKIKIPISSKLYDNIESKKITETKWSESSTSQSSTLCWCCSNAYGGCSWSIKYEPVEGWDAIRNDLHIYTTQDGLIAGPRESISYVVLECPEFVLDERFKEEYAQYSRESVVKKLKHRKMVSESAKNRTCPTKKANIFTRDEMKVIGERIAEKRRERGYTQRYFCDIIGVNLGTYKCWEQGRFPAKNTIKIIRYIGAVLNYDYRFLIYGENKKTLEKSEEN